MIQKDEKIFVAGHRGMVGSAIVRSLKKQGYKHLITTDRIETDLTNQQAVAHFFEKHKPQMVFVAAAKVGGILANNTLRADFIYQNLMIQSNIIHQAYLHNVKRLLFLGSSCIYPKTAPQPLKESYLLTGLLEPTNEPYAIAKIAGIKMCDAYRNQYGCNFNSLMPTNLYGPNDNYHPTQSHVLPAMIRRFHEAKIKQLSSVTIWGTGKPLREFMFVDDLADACVLAMNQFNEEGFINCGVGTDISIKELAIMVSKIVGFKGEIAFDHTKPDGTPRKLMDVSKLNAMGFTPQTSLTEGIELAYQDFLNRFYTIEH